MKSVSFALLLCVLACGPAWAEEEGEAAPVSPTEEPALHDAVAAWDWLQTVDTYRMELMKPARLLREAAATDAQKERAQTAGLDALRLGSALRDEAEEAFRAAFEATDIEAWTVEDHPELNRTGMDLAARHALESDPAAAVVWWDLLIATFPESVEARRAKITWMPLALPAARDPEHAKVRLLAYADEVEEAWRPELLVAVGDLDAIQGDYEGARGWYEKARALIPEDADKNDPRGRLRGHLDLRLRLVGRPAPAVDAARLFGEPPADDGRMRLLPCLAGLPHLEALQAAYPEALQVIGLTREYEKRGVLPERPGLPRALYRGTTRTEYVSHLEAFRERIGMTIPLGLIEADMAARYPIHGLPTMVLIDADGTVGFVAVGGMRQHLLRLAVEQRLDP